MALFATSFLSAFASNVGALRQPLGRRCVRLAGLLLPLWLLTTGAYAQLYYTLTDPAAITRTDQLRRVNLDGSGQVLVTTNFIDTPGPLALDRATNSAFIAETRTTVTPKVIKHDLTSGISTTLVSISGFNGCGGVALDPVNQYVYYAVSDAGAGTAGEQIRRVNYDGTGDVVIVTGYANNSGPLSIDLTNNRLFAMDTRGTANKVVSINLSTSAVTTVIPTPSTSTFRITGIAYNSLVNKLYYSLFHGGAVPAADEVRRINPDGTGDEPVVGSFGAAAIGNLAFDKTTNLLYVANADADAPAIYRVNLNTNTASVFVASPSPDPTTFDLRGIALYPPCEPFTTSLTPSPSSTLTCAQTTLTLTAAGGNSYVFRGPSGVLTGSGNTRTITAPGTYSVTVTNAEGCTAISTTVVSSNTTPPTAGIGSAVTELNCVTSAITLTATGGGTYRWDNNTTNALRNVNVATTYSVTVTGGNGCTAVATKTITGNFTQPTLNLTATDVCAGQSVTLTATPGLVDYIFTTPSGTVNTALNNIRLVPGLAAGPYNFTVVARHPTSFCQATATAGATVAPAIVPTLSASNSGTLTCNVPTLTLTATGGNSYAFARVGGGAGVVSQNATAGTAVVNASGTYSVTVTNTTTSCFSTTTIDISSDQAAPTVSIAPMSGTLTCNVPSLTLTATTSGTGVVWNTTATSTTLAVNTAGTYSVTATGANGCTATTSVTIDQNTTAPSATLSASNSGTLTCAVTSLTLTATGGTSSTYAFAGPGIVSQNAAAGTAVVNASGTYSVTVTGTNGCTATTTVDVFSNTTPPTVTVSPMSGTLTCTNPSLTLTASGTGTSYLWTGGSSSSTLVVSMAGPYSVTATGANGCTAVSNVVNISSDQVAPGSPALTTSNSGTLTCAITSITLTASAIGMGLTYAFAGPSGTLAGSGNTREVSAPGTYTVTITGTNGCTATASTTISSDQVAPGSPLLTASNSGTLTCAITSITLTASAIGMGLTYAFAGPSGTLAGSGNTREVSAPGTYTVTITGANGCTATATTTVFSNTTAPTPTLTPSPSATLTCTQTSLTLTATGGASYAFVGPGVVSQNAMSGTAVINAPGTYSVTVTSANGCTATATTVISLSANLPTATLAASGTLTCAQTSVTLTATGGNSYAFARVGGGAGLVSQNTAAGTAVVNADGTYSVTVTNTTTGCFSVTTTVVESNTTAPTVNVSPTSGTLTCSVTSITLTASGTGTSYRWTGGSMGNTLAVNTAGPYSVTATGANGCTAVSNTVTISQDIAAPGSPALTASNSGTLTCAVTSLTLTASATGTGLTYAFAGPSGMLMGSGNTREVSAPGTYTVTITGANGCTATAITTVFSNTAAPTVSVSPTSGTLTCSVTSLTLTATTSGTGVRWSDNSTGTMLMVNAPGTYSVVATGANGCTATASAIISQDIAAPGSPMLSASNSGTLTCSVTSLTLTASATGMGLTYAFAGPSGTLAGSGNTREVSAPGTYTVTITGANGCTATATTTVSSNTTAPTATLMASSTAVCSPATVTLTAGGGQSYTFSGPGLSQMGTSATAVVSQSGEFTVVVTGANGCTATATRSVTVNTPPAAPALSGASLTVLTSTTPFSLMGLVTATGSNTLAFFSTSGLLNPPNANISTPGIQSFSAVQVSPQGCASPATPFNLTVISPLPPATQSVCRGSAVVLNVLPGGVRYQWFRMNGTVGLRLTNAPGVQLGTTTASLTLVSAQTSGTYTCQVTDANGAVQTVGPFALSVVICGARQAVVEPVQSLQVRVAPNPLVGERLRAIVTGAEGQILTVELTDMQGRILHQQQWPQAAREQVVDWDVQQAPAGTLLLQVRTDRQRQTVKVIKE